ncbi:protein lethal(2)essential for life-like [Pararge aegeria]|uniref:Jg17457 protein n=1 Tax=Pararge aegeria aegeria TaxID=348720 RepID=A0A8S4S1D2_9NEOP|nr:protein lethal(2)essential for life-like [Pararge aegeria]CAH2245061.1 jg17457 [Pararge aegeria aegeria]
MSLAPYFFDYDLPRWPRRLLDQNFGLALTPEDLLTATASPVVPRYRFFWPKDAGSSIKLEKDKWQISVDVQHFAPDEITVKTAAGFIVVEGKHEEKQDDHGFVSRHFVRKFKIPDDTNADAIESRLSSDGVLTVLAPRKEDTLKGERNVPITHTGPIRKEVPEDTLPEKK